ncbi:MAG: molecular chaperone HtpG [Bacillota bacterium]|jgi:molecular chaperone HtpG|nr:molecular chaperone HtpG [Bacillota bacterium]NLL26743.1 molecular chaperone HtpG [Erysipelotrichia bacterium]
MAKKQFKTESKRLLDLMINSIYTNKEIFLRELISNASDALDKRHYLSLTDNTLASEKPLSISISIDKENRILIIEDNGIGMNKKDLEENLGTIAHSGSMDFKNALEKNEEIDIIGQFGVGFYSAFMVAQKIVVETKKTDEPGYRWVSSGQDGYTIDETDRQDIGTKISLHLREDSEETYYSEYLDKYTIESLVKKYSDYIRYPITMMVEKSVEVEGKEGEYETVEEEKTLNTMVPLWRRNKKDITEEDYNSFYKSQFGDWNNPLEVIHYSLEGKVNYKALLYIPSKVPFDFYSKDYQAGLQLYSKGVFIMSDAKDMIPPYYNFVKGLIDTDDVSLNISREILQQDSQLQAINKSVSKRIKSTLVNMLVKEREKYEEFFQNFGYALKYGVYSDYGMHKKELQDLLLFYSSKEDKYVTLKEYKERMLENQNEIYYASGTSIEQIKKIPQLEQLVDKGYEVLYFLDNIDEFVIMMMRDYDGKVFQSAQKASTDIESEEEKTEKEKLTQDNKGLFEDLSKALADKVKEVRISSRLKTHPVCLVADDMGISMEMEKYLAQLPTNEEVKATKILEINPDHEIFKVLQKVYETRKDSIDDYADLLYQQALLIEGFPVDDPVDFSNKICQLMKEANN